MSKHKKFVITYVTLMYVPFTRFGKKSFFSPIKSLLVMATLSCIGQSRNFLDMTVQNFESVTFWGDLCVPIEVSQQRYLGCLAIDMWMNKFQISLFGGNQFAALSMD